MLSVEMPPKTEEVASLARAHRQLEDSVGSWQGYKTLLCLI